MSDHHHHHRRLPVLGAITVAMFLVLAVAAPGTAHAGHRSAPADAAPPTEPETSEPPTTEPETSEPSTTEPATDPAEGVDDDGDDIETTAAVLGILGFIALVGVAAWWMVRLGNDDDAPHPRQPSLDDLPPQQDLM